MKQIKLENLNRIKKYNFGTKEKVLAGIGIFILLVASLIALGRGINTWYDTHYIQFNKIIEIKVNKPIEIKAREVKPQEIVQVIEALPEYKDMTDIEKYICDKWGVYRCATVIAIFKSESGLREDAINTYNSNQTIDYGIAQINSIHWNTEGCKLKQIVEWKGNVDCAYQIWDRADGKVGNSEGNFSPWSAFNSGAFKNKL